MCCSVPPQTGASVMRNEMLLKATAETDFQMRTIDLGYPIYASAYLPYSQELLVAGGGGGSKHGVKNAMVIAAQTSSPFYLSFHLM